MTSALPARERHSPCIGVCKLDEASGLCLGCARTGAEIAAWSAMTEAARDAIWDKLPDRFGSLDVRVRLLPWTGDEILSWAAASFAELGGSWTIGPPGAQATFACGEQGNIQVAAENDAVTARTENAVFRLQASDRLRAFAFPADGSIVLGIAKVRVSLAQARELTALGPDYEAIQPEHRTHALFDIGAGRLYSRSCIRTHNAELIARLRALRGQPWAEVVALARDDIAAARPARLVESMLARIELCAPAEALPQIPASAEEMSASLALPDWVAPIAVFRPAQ